MDQMVINSINEVKLPTDVRQIGAIWLQVALYVVPSIRQSEICTSGCAKRWWCYPRWKLSRRKKRWSRLYEFAGPQTAPVQTTLWKLVLIKESLWCRPALIWRCKSGFCATRPGVIWSAFMNNPFGRAPPKEINYKLFMDMTHTINQ